MASEMESRQQSIWEHREPEGGPGQPAPAPPEAAPGEPRLQVVNRLAGGGRRTADHGIREGQRAPGANQELCSLSAFAPSFSLSIQSVAKLRPESLHPLTT